MNSTNVFNLDVTEMYLYAIVCKHSGIVLWSTLTHYFEDTIEVNSSRWDYQFSHLTGVCYDNRRLNYNDEACWLSSYVESKYPNDYEVVEGIVYLLSDVSISEQIRVILNNQLINKQTE